MNWMRVILSRDDIIGGKHTVLQRAFEQAFMAAGGPKTAEMFENSPSYDEYGYYFSPGAVEIFGITLGSFSASACDAPPRSGTILLIGNADALDRLSADANKDGT
jgi:hypothetical protein